MSSVDSIVEAMKRDPSGVRFRDLQRICEFYFGKPRQSGSHILFKMPWPGDPRISIQNSRGKAKAYQVKQVLLALERLKERGR